MSLQVVVGAGPVGTAIAENLLANGHTVRVITRSGTGPAGAELIAADASDSAALVRLTAGATVIYNCVNPPYDKWATAWPPLAEAFLQAAAASGAVLAMVDNLYAFGPVDGPMAANLPDRPSSIKGAVRQEMWEEAQRAAANGRIKAVVAVRGSDYVGHGPSLLTMLVMPQIRKGKTARVPADLDAPHTWTNPGDAGRLLVRAAQDPRGWNRYWLVPSPPACSIRQLANRAALLEGLPSPELREMPMWMLRLGGVFSSQAKGFVEMTYQFRRPFLLDTSDTAVVFGADHTSLDESLRQNLGLPASAAQPSR